MANNLQISTLSVMAGTPACTRQCRFCISKMTHRVKNPVKTAVPLERIGFLAEQYLRVCSGLPYGIITGKGEPTLAGQEEIGRIVSVLYQKGLIPELQTNGTLLNRQNLRFWKRAGLNTVALSCVSQDDQINQQIMGGRKGLMNLGAVSQLANELGLLVRLTVILTKGGIDSPDSFLAFLKWAKEAGAHQLTFRRMGEPRNLSLPGSGKVAEWIRANRVEPNFIFSELKRMGRESETLPWAQKFTCEGMSLVVTDHMNPPKENVVRHAVIQPDGHLYSSWDDPGDILI